MKIKLAQWRSIQWQKTDQLSRVLLVVLITYLCWKLAALFWLLVAPPQILQIERVELGSMQPRVPNISSFSLFNESTTTVQDNQKFELQGVVVAYPAVSSSAVIKNDEKAERYNIGDTIDGSAYQLAEVYWDHVVLKQQGGASREVRFKGMEQGLYQPLPKVANTSQAAMPNVPTGVDQALEKMQLNHQQYLQNLGVNSAENGAGYEITERSPQALRNTLGLRAGDRIIAMNGQALNQGQSDVQLLEQAKREGQVKLEIQRGDQIMTIRQNFK